MTMGARLVIAMAAALVDGRPGPRGGARSDSGIPRLCR